MGKAGLIDYINDTSQDPTTDGTTLYDSVYEAITRARLGNKNTKAVIVLSDGDDRNSTKTLSEVITHANTAPKIPVFTIYYSDPDYANLAQPAIMHQLAVETGAQDFYAESTSMDNIFSQIWSALTKKYRITYVPTSCAAGSFDLRVDAGSGSLTGFDTKTAVFP